MSNSSIRVDRRRKGSGPVGRAEAPRRQTGGSQGSSLPPSGGTPSSGGLRPSFGGLPSRGGQIGGCGTIVILLLVVGYYLLSGGAGIDLTGLTGDGTGQDGSSGFGTVDQELPQSNFTPPVPAASSGQTWTIMLYQDADDQILERDIFLDLNEAERVGSSNNVNVVAQIDRYRAGFQGDGDWTSARRYYITQDSDLNRINSQVVQDLGEADMSDGATLVDFVQWAAQNYPANKYVLILSDHGMGWPGGWSDPEPGGSETSSAPIASRLGDNLYLDELDQALEQARQSAGIEKFEILGMDACLMSQLEVMAALQPHANYAVASEEVEPSIGWAYAAFLGGLVQNPDMTGADLSKLIVQSYVLEDQRIQDPAARAEFMRGGSVMGNYFGSSSISAEQLSAQLSQDVTLSAIDLNAVPQLMERFNTFSYQLQNEDQQLIAQARTYTQSYTSLFGREVPPSYIDLGHFALLMQANTQDERTTQAVEGVIDALRSAVLVERHGANRKGSTGIAIYFPNSTLYSSPLAGPQSYTDIARRFATESLWDDFMSFHYLDRNFEPTATEPYAPSGSYATRAPGEGQITLSDIRVLPTTTTNNEPVELTVNVSGDNIGYIKIFLGRFDPNSNSLEVTDIDFLESPDVREVSGVFYPQWPDDAFDMIYTWDVQIFAISDGQQNVQALFQPFSYGATDEEAEYVVDGLYAFVQTGEQRYAQLHFKDERLTQVVGLTSETEIGAPREITPEQGDTFTIYNHWMDVSASGQPSDVTKSPGTTLTFGSQPFTWVQLYAAAGDYVIGFIAEDLDGNQYPAYTRLTVQ
jgi:hypothetical protein